MKMRAQSAELEIAGKNEEIAKLKEQLAARSPGPSSTNDGDSGEGDGELRGDGDGDNEDASVRSDSEEEEQEEDDHDMHVMRQLLQDFRDQRLSLDDRQTMMQAAGGQFTDLLTQHWKENSTPPKWLWSLFQPVSTTPSAQVTQLQNSVSSNTAIIKDLKEEIAKLKSAVKQPVVLRKYTKHNIRVSPFGTLRI